MFKVGVYLLTIDQKQQRVDDSERCLQLFQRKKKKKKEFLRKYVTMDETYIQYFPLKSNGPSTEWTAAGESCSKRPNTPTSADNVFASVFWDTQGILLIDYLEKGRTVTSDYYTALLVRLKEEITKNRSQMKNKKCTFTKIKHRVTSRSQRWQNYMNCFCTDHNLKIWLLATAGCLQTSKEIWLQ